MAHAPDTTHGASDPPDLAEHERGWHVFLKSAKWFALHVLGLVFFLIFVLVGHAPFIPTLVIMVLAVYFLGSLFH
jgi:hypothetical protein